MISFRSKIRYVSLFLIFCFINSQILYSYCSCDSVLAGSEKMPIETSLFIQNAEDTNIGSRPLTFWIILGKSYVLEFNATNTTGIPAEMEMTIFLPDEIKRIEGPLSWIGKELNKTISCTIQTEVEGEFLIVAEAANLESRFKSGSKIKIISTNNVEKARQMNELLQNKQQSVAYMESEMITDANNKPQSEIYAPENYAHISGIVYTYQYNNGRSYMLEGIQVELWEDSLFATSPIKTVYTEDPANGSYNDYGLTPVNYVKDTTWYHTNNSGYFDFGNIYVGNGKDLYVRVVFVYHNNGDGTSEAGEEKLRVINDADILNREVRIHYVTFHATSGMERFRGYQAPPLGDDSLGDEAAHIFYDIVKTFGYFRDWVGYTPHKVTARIDYPDTGSPYSTGYEIHFNGWTNDYLIYEKTDSLIHEYSHSIHYSMRGGSFPPMAPGDTNHGNCNNETSSDGLTEGWARFAPCRINKDNNYDWSSTSDHLNIDSNEGDCNTYPWCAAMDKHEWTVGAILWDLHKEIGDIDEWFDNIADTLRWDDPDYVEDWFWGLIADWGHDQEIWQIFFNHNVDYDENGPTIGGVHHSPSSPTSSDSVHVFADVTDDLSGVENGGYVKCKWWISGGSDHVISMNNIGGDTYRTSSPIPSQPGGTEVFYIIDTQDKAGNGTNSALKSYTVEDAPTGSISGHVYDSSGNPLKDAKVEIISGGSGSDYTDDDGYYKITGLDEGYYDLKASKSGYESDTLHDVHVNAGQTTSGQDFHLSPITQPGAIEGHVYDSSGNPLKDAKVEIISGGSGSDCTDDDGYYKITGLDEGYYDLQASKSGYESDTLSNVHVNAGQTTTNQNFYLSPSQTHTLTVQSEPTGVYIEVSPADNNGHSNDNTPFTREYDEGTTVTLTAPPTYDGMTFMNWTRNGSNYSSNRTISFSMDSNYTVKAWYHPTPRALTVQSEPTGVYIEISPADNGGYSGDYTEFTRIYNEGVTVTLTAPSTYNGKNFVKWMRNGSDYSTNRETTITMNQDWTMKAWYNSPPQLSNPSVNPPGGDLFTTFTYQVTYTDPDGDAPTVRNVVINGNSHQMQKMSGDYVSGAVYQYATIVSSTSPNSYYFDFSDGQASVRLPESGTFGGPNIMYDAIYQSVNAPSDFSLNQTFTNNSSFTWSTTNHPVTLSVRWIKNGTVVKQTQLPLPSNVSNGDVAVITGELQAPGETGGYTLEVQMQQEGAGLFSQQGDEPYTQGCHVGDLYDAEYLSVLYPKNAAVSTEYPISLEIKSILEDRSS